MEKQGTLSIRKGEGEFLQTPSPLEGNEQDTVPGRDGQGVQNGMVKLRGRH